MPQPRVLRSTRDMETIPGFESWNRLPTAGDEPCVSATLRRCPEDFVVEEILGFEPTDVGQHVWLRLRKRNTNTEWLARRIAAVAGVPRADVGFAGLKDRVALTTQWFSVDTKGARDLDWSGLASDEIEVLEVRRHSRKLRRGTLAGNRFRLLLGELEGDRDGLEAALDRIVRDGVPNYFGPQRFGRDGGNIARAWDMLVHRRRVRDRSARGIYISAARSLLFNAVLARRVENGDWNRVLAGDVVMLDGTHSIFGAGDSPDADVQARVAIRDLHPTGPLWGRGSSPVDGVALGLEKHALANYAVWQSALENAGLEHQRRALRVNVGELTWEPEPPGELRVEFNLPAGSYATAVMREVVRSS